MKYKQHKRTLSAVMAMVLIIGCIEGFGAAIAVEPHPFAIALKEFFEGVNGHTAAVLADLDGDGEDEMIAIIPSVNEWDEPSARLGIFSTKYQSVIYDCGFLFETDSIYISDKNYITEDLELGYGGGYNVLEYDSGKIKVVSLINYPEPGEYEYMYSRDETEHYITRSQFEKYLTDYGVYNKKKVLYSSYDDKVTNETTSILVMTTSQSALKVNPTASIVLVNGISTNFEAYNINGNNYFKLRDLAFAVSGTEKQFNVGWDSITKAITLTSGVAYTLVGGEMAVGDGVAKSATLNTDIIISRNGTQIEITAYLIGGYNFVKLRDVMRMFDIGVTWDGANNKIGIDTSLPYKD